MVLGMESPPGGPATTTSTVYIVDDDASIRRLLSWLMEKEGVHAEAFANAETFLEKYRDGGPGCLVLDLKLRGMDGLGLQQRLKERGIDLPIIFISGTAQVAQAVQAVKDGAVDFIVKPFDYKKVVEVVCGCLRRASESYARRREAKASQATMASLTPREREVMERVVAGKLNRMIADELEVSIKTVEAHRSRIMEKLQVHSVAELVRLTMSTTARLGFTLIVGPYGVP